MIFRRIFKFRKFDSVRAVICGFERIDYKHLYTHVTLKCVKSCINSHISLVSYLGKIMMSNGCKRHRDFVGIDVKSLSIYHFTVHKLQLLTISLDQQMSVESMKLLAG